MAETSLIDHLLDFQNPALYGLIVVAVLIIILLLMRKGIIKPKIRREEEVENENLKLMALFAEIDPDPILRVDNNGKIIGANNTANIKLKKINLIGSNFPDLIPDIKLENYDFLNDKVVCIEDRYFNISVRRLSSLNFHQVYLHDITDRIKYELQIKDYQSSLQKLRAKLEDYNENEKQRLGRELHDGIGHNVSLLKIKIQNFLSNNPDKGTDELIEGLLSDIDKLADDIKNISYQLRPRILNEFGLIPALSSIIDSINNSTEMRGSLSPVDSGLRFVKEFEINLFRICQEAISNIVRHSQCRKFFLQFLFSENALRLIISDDGSGFDADNVREDKHTSLGLLNMKERVSIYNGEFNLETSPNEGTTIFIVINNIEEYRLSDTNNNS